MADAGGRFAPLTCLSCVLRAAAEAAEDVRGPVVLATASGRGPAEIRALTAGQGRVVEGVSADGYFVDPSLVADDVLPPIARPSQASAPITANAHTNAAMEPTPVPAPEADQEPGVPAALTAPAPAAGSPAAGASPRDGNANAHNNSA